MIDMDVASLAGLLHETAEHHGSFEAVAPPHDWWDWYAAYMDARQRGSTPEEGLRDRRTLHGGGQARRRLARLTSRSSSGPDRPAGTRNCARRP